MQIIIPFFGVVIWEIFLLCYGFVNNFSPVFYLLLMLPIVILLTVKLISSDPCNILYVPIFLIITIPTMNQQIMFWIKLPVISITILVVGTLIWEKLFCRTSNSFFLTQKKHLSLPDYFFFIWLGTLILAIAISISYSRSTKDVIYFSSLYITSIGYVIGKKIFYNAEKILPYILVASVFFIAVYFFLSWRSGFYFVRCQTDITALFGITFSVYMIVFSEKMMDIVMGVIGLFFGVMVILFSLARTLWISFMIGVLFAFFIMYLFGEKFQKRRVILLLGIIMGIVAGLTLYLIIYYRIFSHSFFNKVIPVLYGKMPTSIIDRQLDIKDVWKLFLESPVWGKGVSSQHWAKWKHAYNPTLDNGYLDILWHFGFWGFVSLIGLILSTFFLAIRKFIKSKDIISFFIIISTIEILVASIAINPFRYAPLYIYYIIIGAFVQNETAFSSKNIKR